MLINETLTKSLSTDRSSFPFITSDGSRSLLTDAVDDLVIWIDPNVTHIPLKVTSQIDDDILIMEFSDDTLNTSIKASENSSVLVDSEGAVSGYILWNSLGAGTLKEVIRSGEYIPDTDIFVDMCVCVPCMHQPLTKVSINGSPILDNDIILSIDKEDGSIIVDDTSDENVLSKCINLYGNIEDTYKGVSKIKFIPGGSMDAVTLDGLDGHIWLKSDAECDIRVITNDNITITEITNEDV